MSALDKIIMKDYPPREDNGWIEYALHLLWSEIVGYEHVSDNAAEELAALRAENETMYAALLEAADLGSLRAKVELQRIARKDAGK